MKEYMHAYDITLFVMMFWLVLAICGGVWSSLYLRFHTALVGNVLLHPQAGNIFWIMKIMVLMICVGLPIFFTGTECGHIDMGAAMSAQNLDINSAATSTADLAVAVTSSCIDEAMNGGETDVDCGGDCSRRCGQSRGCTYTDECATGLDCVGYSIDHLYSSVCLDETRFFENSCIDTQVDFLLNNSATLPPTVGICTVPDLCANGVLDPGETCIDGGGPCRARAVPLLCGLDGTTATCEAAADCAGTDMRCSPDGECHSCSNNLQDGDETDANCGGTGCPACRSAPRAAHCLENSDCIQPAECVTDPDLSTLTVAWYTCVSHSNGVQDGAEVDRDCGGCGNATSCDAVFSQQCGIMQRCVVNDDCISNYCNTTAATLTNRGYCKTYTEPHCENNVMDYSETGIDCGGTTCRSLGRLCGSDAGCSTGNDCQQGMRCDVGGTGKCFACSNRVRDGSEVDMDCGGGCGTGCGDVAQQVTAVDATSQRVTLPACVAADGVTARACRCYGDRDCTSGRCCKKMDGNGRCFFDGFGLEDQVGECISYANGVIDPDGDETDVDCGGGATGDDGPLRCAIAQMCAIDDDCLTHNCENVDATSGRGTCGAVSLDVTCQSGTMDADETDVDCGGSGCPGLQALAALATPLSGRCVDGLMCRSNSDCESNNCDRDGKCVSCQNSARDGDETDVDCGGSCNACADSSMCQADTDCNSNNCFQQTCSSCMNTITDGDETDVDCGGSCPRQCGVGLQCVADDDCAGSTVCTDFLCTRTDAAACTDGVQAPTPPPPGGWTESDIDCGGDCSAAGYLCAAGSSCTADLDCDARICDSTSNTCVTCQDTIRNGNESDVDCGGTNCGLCPAGSQCGSGADCATGQCSSSGICSSCTNGRMDGEERGIDCGGLCSPRCDVGERCIGRTATEPADLTSCLPQLMCGLPVSPSTNSLCRVLTEAEQASDTCTNGVQDGLETCVDGGGPLCSSIGRLCSAPDGTCSASSDCAPPGSCTIPADLTSGTCTSCRDGVKNSDESDVDCGGRCNPCADQEACFLNRDCVTSLCYIHAGDPIGQCISHSNGRIDGDETDRDCGGTSGQLCGEGSNCSFTVGPQATPVVPATPSDISCLSGFCNASSFVCATPAAEDPCNDGVLSGSETDVDCGGADCAPCGLSMKCNVPSDCDGGSSSAVLVCTMDIGRPVTSSTSCTADGDCPNGECRIYPGNTALNHCVGTCSDCNDGIMNGIETDIDCGGNCPSRCSAEDVNGAQDCGSDSDCASGNRCLAGTCVLPRPVSVSVSALSPPVAATSGISLIGLLGVVGQRAPGQTTPTGCSIIARLSATAGLELDLPRRHSTLPPNCPASSLPVQTASGDYVFNGPYDCVNYVLGAIRFETGCNTPWNLGTDADSPTDDFVESMVTLTIETPTVNALYTPDGLCAYAYGVDGALAGTKAIRITGRPELVLQGSVINANCVGYAATASADPCNTANSIAVAEATVGVTLSQCAEASTAQLTCSDVANPDFPTLNCCDWDQPFPGQNYHCGFLISSMHVPCTMATPVNMPERCAETCSTSVASIAGCDIANLPPVAGGTFSATGDGAASETVGGFTLSVSFDDTGRGSNYVQAVVEKPGKQDTVVIAPLLNGLLDVGHVYMVEAGGGASNIQGHCLDAFSTIPNNNGLMARLAQGQIIYPSIVDSAYPAAEEMAVDAAGLFSFTGVAAGVYTLTCFVTDSAGVEFGTSVFAVSNGPQTPTFYPPMLVPRSTTGLLISSQWQVFGAAGHIPDLDLHATFYDSYPVTSASQTCHVFDSSPACGGTNFFDLSAVTAASSMALQGEAIEIATVYPLIYTLYIHYPTQEVTDAIEYVDVTTNIYGQNGKLHQITGNFAVVGAGSQRFMRLACIDATQGVPQVHAAVLPSSVPPSECRSCPC